MLDFVAPVGIANARLDSGPLLKERQALVWRSNSFWWLGPVWFGLRFFLEELGSEVFGPVAVDQGGSAPVNPTGSWGFRGK